MDRKLHVLFLQHLPYNCAQKLQGSITSVTMILNVAGAVSPSILVVTYEKCTMLNREPRCALNVREQEQKNDLSLDQLQINSDQS